jgi:hypothetical protein
MKLRPAQARPAQVATNVIIRLAVEEWELNGHSSKLAQIFGLSKTIAALLRENRHLDHQPVSCHLPPRTV